MIGEQEDLITVENSAAGPDGKPTPSLIHPMCGSDKLSIDQQCPAKPADAIAGERRDTFQSRDLSRKIAATVGEFRGPLGQADKNQVAAIRRRSIDEIESARNTR